MEARLKLKPGQRGTKKMVELYGTRLVCVRYRYDEARQKRLKTVELVVEEIPWTPGYKPNTLVSLRIEFTELELQERVKVAGGKWDSRECLWDLRYQTAVSLGLKDRIVKRKASNNRDKNASNSR
jgi:hypothetical protein